MTEKYLHYLWGSKQFPIANTRLTNGNPIVVKDVGEYNENLKGPDFQLGAVAFNEVTEFGPIELHLKSSDWYAHQHHLDDNYNNVILHVVYEDDKPVIQNGRVLPTLELKAFIEERKLKKETQVDFFNLKFPCANRLGKVDDYFISRMIDLAFVKKMKAKLKMVSDLKVQNDTEVLYVFLVVAFGRKVNRHLFIELLEEMPYVLMRRLLRTGQIHAFVHSLKEKLKQSLNWHTKGIRPKGFPDSRIDQLVEFLKEMDIERITHFCNKESFGSFHQFLEAEFRDLSFTSGFKHHLIINAFAPFLWYRAEKDGDERFHSEAIKLLTLIPCEENSEIKKISKVFGEPRNAYESQGLMALNHYFCSRKKCLSCDVGNKVLNRL